MLTVLQCYMRCSVYWPLEANVLISSPILTSIYKTERHSTCLYITLPMAIHLTPFQKFVFNNFTFDTPHSILLPVHPTLCSSEPTLFTLSSAHIISLSYQLDTL